MMKYTDLLSTRKGIGAKTSDLFAKIGVYTIGDILCFFPREYLKYPQLSLVQDIHSDGVFAVMITPRKSPITKNGRRMSVTTLNERVNGVLFSAIWFRSPYIAKQIRPNVPIILYGRTSIENEVVKMEQPRVFALEDYKQLRKSLQPVYSLTSGLSNNMISKTVKAILNDIQDDFDFPPTLDPKLKVLSKNKLANELKHYYEIMHFPKSIDALAAGRNHFVFDEFFWFIIRLQLSKTTVRPENNCVMSLSNVESYYSKLPYELTGAQRRTIKKITDDFRREYVSQHLIQGDVGSGKTAVAYFAMLDMHLNGYQSAIMAPTEVLARQHYESFTAMNKLLGLDIPIILLVGSLTAKEHKLANERIASTQGAFIIGTHAIFWKTVEYNKLGLVITDEQHRFGVAQREALALKGESTHILVMSATPIPRTLAMILYGDMDVCVIDEVPAKRLPIKNALIPSSDRDKAYRGISAEVDKGHQAYVICPFVEESESLEGENVIDYTEKLRTIFGDKYSISTLHGRMSAADKNEVMTNFAEGLIDILVSTTVVEVGVNVPNATVILIENAGRFGLAALHQLRGRVGRGSDQSYCIFVDELKDEKTKERLSILTKSNDGFFVASSDLKMRGPGDFFGIRQSGEMAFKLGDIYQDASVLEVARDEVVNILSVDPYLENEENTIISEYLATLAEREKLLL